jgi:two-component system C4-dicarboxylate transport response regulator DctD
VQLFSRAEDCLAQLPAISPGDPQRRAHARLSGLELLAEVQRRDADLPVILLTGHGDVPMAVEAMRDGAYDFLEKPFSPDALLGSLRRALDKRRLVLENRRLHEQADHRAQLESSLLGVSRGLQNLRRQVLDLAGLPVNVLIRGETGSGKELVARCLHDFGPRATSRSWRSTARRSPSNCSKPSCSATKAAPSPAPRASASASWNTPTAARCSSMKSKACPWPSR